MLRAVFPGGLCPTISLLISSLTKGSKNRLIVDSVENIGPHYARTLREWARRFNDCFDDVIAPTLREEHPTVMDGERGAKELEIFRRKWMCAYSTSLPGLLSHRPFFQTTCASALQHALAAFLTVHSYYCEVGFQSRTLGDHIMTFTREVSSVCLAWCFDTDCVVKADASYGCNVFA